MARIPREFKRNLGDHDTYNRLILARNFSEDELRDEYRRLRANFAREVRRIKANPDFADTQITRSISRFDPPSTLNKLELASALSDLEGLMSQHTSTLAGLKRQRERTIETFRDRGFEGINVANFREFTKFMEATRSLAFNILRYNQDKFGRLIGEDKTKRLELFQLAQRKGLTMNAIESDFRFFVTHMDELEQLPDRPSGRKMGARTARKAIKNL